MIKKIFGKFSRGRPKEVPVAPYPVEPVTEDRAKAGRVSPVYGIIRGYTVQMIDKILGKFTGDPRKSAPVPAAPNPIDPVTGGQGQGRLGFPGLLAVPVPCRWT